ncbi:unnamed protein product [Symbiodinium sp. KB8]|nr:unnamed protein product [Symbiodinium sp. KB8]
MKKLFAGNNRNNGSVSDAKLDGAKGIDVLGNFVYVAAYTYGGITFVDISDSSNPTVRGSVQAASLAGSSGIVVDGGGNYAIVACETSQHVIQVNIVDPDNPSVAVVADAVESVGATFTPIDITSTQGSDPDIIVVSSSSGDGMVLKEWFDFTPHLLLDDSWVEVDIAECFICTSLMPNANSLLFADLEEPFRKNSSDLLRCSSAASYQNLRRDYPDFGDSALSFYQDGVGRAGLLVCHPCEEDGRFDVIGVFNVPHEKFDDWSAIHFNLVLESAQRVADRFLNGPSISTMRESDEYFYIVLTIQSCKRGLPLVPLVTDELPTTTIVAGERLGLDRWIRFNPESVGSSKFYLSEYIKVLLSNVGENIDAYNSMDGRTLMPYQCAVRREQWSSLRTRFVEVFLLQKTAYRRANGGSTAPSMHEGVEPRFSPDTSVMLLRERLFRGKSQTAHQKVLVRRTFLELEEDEYKMGRDQRRHKTTTVLPENSPILAA